MSVLFLLVRPKLTIYECCCYSYCADFFCRYCNAELSNVYMRCDACDKVFNMDFNICCGCHKEGRYKTFVNMHPTKDSRSILNHTGDKEKTSKKVDCCKSGLCAECSYCAECSCRCHHSFSACFRFMDIDNEIRILLESVKKIVGTNTIFHHNETLARLLSMI